MDSKVVNVQIKKAVWPQLKQLGFSSFSPRTAWRHDEYGVDVVDFQSYNSYNAEVLGCTTYSFSVNLGRYLNCIPPSFEPDRTKRKGALVLPKEYQCHFRSRLARSLEQPELRERSIWYIDPEAKYLGWALQDVSNQLLAEAIPWFAKLQRPADALEILNQAEMTDELWGFGNKPSPIRHYMTAYVADATGHGKLASNEMLAALESNCFVSVENRMRTDLKRMAQGL